MDGNWTETVSKLLKIWRRDRDSNPGYPFEYTRFPSVRLQPLGHLSVGRLVVEAPEARRFSIVTYSKVLLRVHGGAFEKMWRDSPAGCKTSRRKICRRLKPAREGQSKMLNADLKVRTTRARLPDHL